MNDIVLKGHKVTKGKAQGEALVCPTPVSFEGMVNSETGLIAEKGHVLEGVSVTDKIFVYPFGKGSTVGSYQLYELAVFSHKGPRAIINLRADPVTAGGAILSNIPMVDKLDRNPLEVIKTGDLVEVDADQGMVTVHPKSA